MAGGRPSVRLSWYGAEVARGVRAAELAAVQATLDAAAERARMHHAGWTSRSGAAERSISAARAESAPAGAHGRFGFSVGYGVFLERRDRTLARAADEEFPHLAERIRARLTAQVRSERHAEL